ncbi:MAG: SLBB domain-containing protein, partial [Saprospiraceae bacterium]|nr:SLBB domain-containing protein [Saprospiraceae bacterium]
MKQIFLIIITLFLGLKVQAQVLDSSQLLKLNEGKSELQSKGISEDEVRQRLLEKGIDINNVSPANALEVERQVREVVAELEAEKKANMSQPAPGANVSKPTTIENTEKKENSELTDKKLTEFSKDKAENIKKAVEQGKTLEDAIAEEVNDIEVDTTPAAIYGQEIFRNSALKFFNQAQDVRPPSNYVLGPGDEITISIWGLSQGSFAFEINKDGYIEPYRMGRIFLKGLTYDKAKELLRSRYSVYYRFAPEQFEVTIKYTRTISVNIYGEVAKPGSYSVPAMNTAFNALVVAGGPNNIGSVRNIKLIRAGQKPKRIDVYEFMNNPSKQEDFYLQSNDIIHIPVAERTVKIQGAIKRPYKYELIDGEQLKALISYAGGFNENAYQATLQVKRYENDKEVIEDIEWRNLQLQSKDFALKNGDVIIVNTIPKPYLNYVEVSGAIDLPGKYEISAGMKVSDLIKRSVLSYNARTDIAYLQRMKPDETYSFERLDIDQITKDVNSTSNYLLKPQDKLIIFAQPKFTEKRYFTVDGYVREPFTLPYDETKNIKVSDAIVMAGGILPEATTFAYLKRKNPENSKSVEYLRVNLENAISNPNGVDNVEIKANDTLYVYSKLKFIDDAFVTLSGSVRTPGEFKYDESLTLKDLIILGGGLKLEAASNKIDIFRLVIKDNLPTKTIVATTEIKKDINDYEISSNIKLEPYDLIVVRSIPQFDFLDVVNIEGEVMYPGEYALTVDNEKIVNLIQRAGGLTPEAFPAGATLYRPDGEVGFIVMKLDEALRNGNSNFNFILKKGDVIQIPKQKDLVTIQGATRAYELYPEKILLSGKLTVAYHSSKSAKWYIDEYAAGVSDNGDKRKISVYDPNGRIRKTKDFGLFKIYPKV